jgi:predicted DCC family thiol-disulfide oxidoreductase YuxK
VLAELRDSIVGDNVGTRTEGSNRRGMCGNHILVYDGGCQFCRVTVGFLIWLDRHCRLMPTTLQDAERGELLSTIPAGDRWRSWHLIQPDGAVWSAGAVVMPLVRELCPRGAGRIAMLGFPAATRLYWIVARSRSRLGRCVPNALVRRAESSIERRTMRLKADRALR